MLTVSVLCGKLRVYA